MTALTDEGARQFEPDLIIDLVEPATESATKQTGLVADLIALGRVVATTTLGLALGPSLT